jgi:hypothetical protein
VSPPALNGVIEEKYKKEKKTKVKTGGIIFWGK